MKMIDDIYQSEFSNSFSDISFNCLDGNIYSAERCKDLEKGNCDFTNIFGYMVTLKNGEMYLIFAPDIATAKFSHIYSNLMNKAKYIKEARTLYCSKLEAPFTFFGRIYKLTKKESTND